ncbi:MAG: hypothetical protein ACHQHN_04065 [Sphingobacteriales bacterium]
MKLYHICTVIILIICTSCNSSNKQVLAELAERYPDLYKNDVIQHFTFVRSLADSSLHIEMQLLQGGEGQIVVLTNSGGQKYAIPFPSNRVKDYWEFYGDSSKNVKNHDKTFISELNNAYKVLSIHEFYRGQRIFDEIAITLLGSRPISVKDTALINHLAVGNCYKDSISHTKLKKSYQSILQGLKAKSPNLDFSTYSDLQHGRIYQLRWGLKPGSSKEFFNVKVYEEQCYISEILVL